ncbi:MULTISPECIES: FMN-binding protein [unclassified Streptococcus]|uniref:FMN-binding protein n=1 Tax=unclassified Streptococcus TaxID=2608887 RepID=UPI001072D99A|nr:MULTISPECIES: FMN-binding protein [unclassified Streptococcus]MBF0787590.1 FMN-binding protein [Streptococcus sp. 19428wC2_LYSM12]MCQ9211977.1 FMN-binding protein [Streptococcus sp. B01]MCQ9213306.1 FMN-binding protein [Streptococcus sp. O1]TFV05433.1 FMN-binding protein [Streptococcus sp. LYSM12]
MKTTRVMLKSVVVLAATFALVACGAKEDKKDTAMSSSETTMSSSAAETKMMAELKDGTYSAESAPDERGFKIVHTITVKDGKITESKFDYEDKDGKMKSENEEYNKMMSEKAGISAKETIEKLNAALVEKQDVAAVEVVSGATHTSEDFKKSTTALLAAAEKGDTAKVMLDK